MRPGASSERAVILAPTGRDASVAAALIKEAGLLRQYLQRSCRADARNRERRRPRRDRRRGDQDRGFARPGALAERSAVMVGFSDRAADASGRRPRAQSGRGAARAGAGQRHLHRAAVSSDHAGERRRLRGPGPAPPVPDPRDSRGSHRKRRPAADRAERRPSRRAGTASCRSSSSKPPTPARRFSDAGPASRFHTRICWRRFIPTTARGASRCWIRPIKTGGDYSIEYRNIWPDGSQHWVDVRARAVRRPDGSIKSLVGVSSDITARKVAEIERENLLAQLAAERTALAELTATLEQRVEQRTADLMKEVAAREKAQEQLRQAQKMETIGQLTGGVAHDFNNLLMAVMGNLDLLRKRIPDDPRLHRLIDGALQGAERGASLTQRLLAFARQQDLQRGADRSARADPGHDRSAGALAGAARRAAARHSPRGCRRRASMPTSSNLRFSISRSTRATRCPTAARSISRSRNIRSEQRPGAEAGPLPETVRHRYRQRA